MPCAQYALCCYVCISQYFMYCYVSDIIVIKIIRCHPYISLPSANDICYTSRPKWCIVVFLAFDTITSCKQHHVIIFGLCELTMQVFFFESM